MTRHPLVGVSADGLMQLRPPDDHDMPVYAAVEIKTKISSALIAEARHVRSAYGAYFECTVGSEVWFKAVPWAYRGQLVHQALVLSLDKVVFVMATVYGLIFRGGRRTWVLSGHVPPAYCATGRCLNGRMTTRRYGLLTFRQS